MVASFCCCGKKPITMDVDMDKTAFAIGESIKFRLHISNMSNTSLDGIRVGLIRVNNFQFNL